MKDAQQLAEETLTKPDFFIDIPFAVKGIRYGYAYRCAEKAFISGHGSRDAEVNKLVEALREAIKLAENQYEENKASADWFNNNMPGIGINLQYQSTIPLPKWVEKAKEALKPYQNE